MLKDLLSVYSPSREEKCAVEILRGYAKELGYENVVIDEVGNLIASYGSGDIKFAAIGHIDTIPWELPTTFDGDTIFGRGAVDAKGPLTAAFIGLALAKNTIDVNKVSVYAVALVDEEGDSLGAKHLIKSGFKAHGVVIAEPSNTNGVVLGYRGSIKMKIVCKGPGGHSSSGTKDSACEKLITIWQKLESLVMDKYRGKNTPALLKLCCGEDVSVSPRYGEATVSIRISIDSDIEVLLKDVERILDDLSGCTHSILDITKPIKVSTNNVVARALIRTLLRSGIKPRILYKYGTSDMNILFPYVTKDIVAYGPGRSELAHTAEERISVDELIQGINVYRDLTKEFADLYEKML